MKNPSWKIDELARRVLQAAHWPTNDNDHDHDHDHDHDVVIGHNHNANANDAGASSSSPTPNLDELERALEIRLPPLTTAPIDQGDGIGGGGSSSSGVRTCTAPAGGSQEKTTNDVWTWTPRTNTTDNSYSKSQQHAATTAPDDDDHDHDGRTLEDMAPFSPDFYRACGELAREAYHPGSAKHHSKAAAAGTAAGRDGAATRGHAHDAVAATTTATTTIYASLRSLERYSVPRMMDAARITRILLSLQELDIASGNSEQEEEEEGGGSSSFAERLLHYCEGMPLSNNAAVKSNDDNGNSHRKASNAGSKRSTAGTTKGKRMPILSALFRHWANLPQLEHGLQRLSRKYGALLPVTSHRYRDYCEYCSSSKAGTSSGLGNGSSGSSSTTGIGDGGSTGGDWKPSSATSFLGDRALRIDSFKMRMEEELQRHINGGKDDEKVKLGGPASRSGQRGGLIELLSTLYRSCNATLRGKCRRWMGQWLRSFALGGGNKGSYSTMRAGDGAATAAGGGNADAGAVLDNGLGPSFASFCPLVAASSSSTTNIAGAATGPVSMTLGGGGMPHNPLGMENTSACGVEALLHVLLSIVMGFRPIDARTGSATNSTKSSRRSELLRPSQEHLLFDVVLPLHRPAGLVLWRDQTPLIGLYHESLVKVLGAFISMDRTLVGPIIGALLHPDIWPGSEGGNTPKVVLLLHEADALIGLLLQSADSAADDDEEQFHLASFDAYLLPVANRLCACISSENSRTSERALQFFRNATFARLVRRRLDEVGYLFLRALCRRPGGEVPWNPTVRKMTLLVLTELEGYYYEHPSESEDDGSDLFGRACEAAFSGVDFSSANAPIAKITKSAKGTAKVDKHSGDGPAISGDMTTLRGAMGSWKPPPQQKARVLPSKGNPPGKGVAPWAAGGHSHGKGLPTATASGKKQPPVTVTGVAPWAVKKPGGLPSRKQPPVTITGVAPWAVSKSSSGLPSMSSRRSSTSNAIPRPSKKHGSRSRGQPLPEIPSENAEIGIAEAEDAIDIIGQKNDERPNRTPLEEVRSYMKKLKPKGDDESSKDGISSWAKAQMEESPVLLPNLKFHDLVFGQDLGTGAFSTVKYARRIVKTSTRSNWPEYAVKVVSTQKIEELGYEQSINREIATLRTLSHPGISRLVSSFRFRDGAYLILEYASGGDLHTLLRKNGSLDHESTRFVIGSVAAALWSIHELGFVYADCKPENILITETGHIKVTDFGGCRPVTRDAKLLVKESSENLLKQLRDGDWKANATNASISDGSLAGGRNDDEDLRIEGTTAYLPPEVVIGGYPTTAADVWALGCVLFQCISGRPPILEDTDDLTAQRIVTFDLNSDKDNFFGEYDASTFRDDAKALIQRMLNRDEACRPDILQIAEDDFFDGKDIFSLHKSQAHPLDVGSIAPTSDAKWSRRQFSSIWAPQPRAYNVGSTSNHTQKAGTSRNEPIIEGDEADEEFLPRQKAPLLTKIRE